VLEQRANASASSARIAFSLPTFCGARRPAASRLVSESTRPSANRRPWCDDLVRGVECGGAGADEDEAGLCAFPGEASSAVSSDVAFPLAVVPSRGPAITSPRTSRFMLISEVTSLMTSTPRSPSLRSRPPVALALRSLRVVADRSAPFAGDGPCDGGAGPGEVGNGFGFGVPGPGDDEEPYGVAVELFDCGCGEYGVECE
jgi:hypothetical protein